MTTETDESSLEQKFSRILCVLFKTTACLFPSPIYNGHMLGGQKDIQKNLKDTPKDSIKDTFYVSGRYDISSLRVISYTKTHKLITALYMVTDIIDRDEPLRNKLRTLGTGIISDMNSLPHNACGKIFEVMSFLDIASAMSIISEMNCNILRKEFAELDQSIKESIGRTGATNSPINLSEFFREELEAPSEQALNSKGHQSIGHRNSTRIGVQKGSTLLKALSNTNLGRSTRDEFDLLKKERRYDITNFISKNGGSASITDIKNGKEGSIVSCSEKTLQRELISMVKDGVLYKTGDKRWSKYFLKQALGS